MSAARTTRPDAGRPRTRVSRGTLSREHIVDATLRLVRDEPDGPITMERVAAVLGTRPMSLYTHVRNRDELVALAAQQALREWDAVGARRAPAGTTSCGPGAGRCASTCRPTRRSCSR